MTVDAFHPGLCHEGIENATVTRIGFLSGPLPVAVDPRKEHEDDDDDDGDDDEDGDDDDDDEGDDDEDDDDDDDGDDHGDDEIETPRATQIANHTVAKGGGGGGGGQGVPTIGRPNRDHVCIP